MASGPTYTPIATTTLGSSSATVTFSSIASTYTDLILIVSGTMATGAAGIALQFNSDTATNYSNTYLAGDGSTAFSGRASSASSGLIGYLGTGQSNSIIHIMNYANTTTYKTALGRASAPANYTIARVALWRSTSAINSIAVKSDGDTFASGTVFTLYGIAAA